MFSSYKIITLYPSDSYGEIIFAQYDDPLNGRFNQLDPYAGNTQDPQSLHKYLYCHANPVNGIDPSGNMEFSIAGLSQSLSIGIVVFGIFTAIGVDVFVDRGFLPDQLLNNPIVNNAMRSAYTDSHVGTPNAKEQGGTIFETSAGRFKVIRWNSGIANQIQPLYVPYGASRPFLVVGSFHTHPNPNVVAGWRQEPSEADLRWFGANRPSAGNIHFVIAYNRIYVITRSLIIGRVKWRDFAPTSGNLRQEMVGVSDEL